MTLTTQRTLRSILSDRVHRGGWRLRRRVLHWFAGVGDATCVLVVLTTAQMARRGSVTCGDLVQALSCDENEAVEMLEAAAAMGHVVVSGAHIELTDSGRDLLVQARAGWRQVVLDSFTPMHR